VALGFAFDRAAYDGLGDGRLREWGVQLPLWALAVTLTLLPATRLIRRVRRHARGHCSRCGYDLRATPDRCPECGTIAAAPTAA